MWRSTLSDRAPTPVAAAAPAPANSAAAPGGEDSMGADDDDEDIYEKYDKLLYENNKLNDKIKKISEYTNMEFCRSAKIVSYIKEEIKRK